MRALTALSIGALRHPAGSLRRHDLNRLPLRPAQRVHEIEDALRKAEAGLEPGIDLDVLFGGLQAGGRRDPFALRLTPLSAGHDPDLSIVPNALDFARVGYRPDVELAVVLDKPDRRGDRDTALADRFQIQEFVRLELLEIAGHMRYPIL